MAQVQYDEGVNADARSAELSTEIANQKLLPANVSLKLEAFKFGFTMRGDDMVVSFYAPNNDKSLVDLTDVSTKAAAYLKSQNIPVIEDISIISPFEEATNPQTNQRELTQKSFDRYGDGRGH